MLSNCENNRILIIGSGPSTKNIVRYKNCLKECFDVIIGINSVFLEFEDLLNFHMIPEANAFQEYDLLNDKKIIKNPLTPRIVDESNIKCVDKPLNVIGCKKVNIDYLSSFKRYDGKSLYNLAEKFDDSFGPIGTAFLQSLHFAVMLGAQSIFIIGSEFCFADSSDRFYNTKFYSNLSGGIYEKTKIIRGNRTYNTMLAFKLAALTADFAINKFILPEGIKIYDFSNGLMSSPKKLDLDKFMCSNGVQNEGCV